MTETARSAGTIEPDDDASRSGRRAVGVGALVVCGVVSVVVTQGDARVALVAALWVLVTVLLLLTRRSSLPVAAVVIGLTVVEAAGLAILLVAPGGLGAVPCLLVAARIPRLRLGPSVQRALVLVLVVVFTAAVVLETGSALGLLAGFGPWTLARRAQEQQELEAERDRALALLTELRATRALQREAAAAAERTEIAREMHDVLAHSLAGLSVQLQAARLTAAAQGASPDVVAVIDRAAGLAREGLQEAKAAVSMLREPRRKGLEDLGTLAETFPGSVCYRPPAVDVTLSADAGHAVYRAVQEALTNSARYASGSDVEVTASVAGGPGDGGGDELVVTVQDRGPLPGREPQGADGGGAGLLGMAERVGAVGGATSAGPRDPGPGWQVEVRVPVARQ